MRGLRVPFPKPCDEAWAAMAPSGSDSFGARCDAIVRDLYEYTREESEAFLRDDLPSCERAQLGANGVVVLKPDGRRAARRMVLATAASVALLTTPEGMLAQGDRAEGTIAGKLDEYDGKTRITATASDSIALRGHARHDGSHVIRELPAGRYMLTSVPGCGEAWTAENVVVTANTWSVVDTANPNGCIIVALRIENHEG